RHGFGHAMGRKHDGAMAMLHRDFTEFLDEDGAPLLQAFNHIAVVHDLVAHIDRSPVLLQRKHNDLDRPTHASTKAPRPTKTYGQLWLVTIQGHYLKSPVTRGRWRLSALQSRPAAPLAPDPAAENQHKREGKSIPGHGIFEMLVGKVDPRDPSD